MEIKVNSELKYLVDSIDGKESIPDEEVYIQNSQPEDGKIWIDTGEISNLGTEVVNSLEGNQTNKAPSVKAVKDKISSLPQGTITGIKMNGASKGTSGVIDLGTVLTSHQDISGKQDKLTTQTAYSAKGSATKVPQITTNTLGQVTSISEVTITQPTVNNATLTIQKNGSNVATFTANASSNVTANITVPTITDTYSSTSTNGMSGKAVASAISGKVVNASASNYLKMDDGTLICWGQSGNMVMAKGGGANTWISLPVAMKDTNYKVVTTIATLPSYWSWVQYATGDKQTGQFYLTTWNNTNEAAVTLQIQWLAIGRWK